MLVNRCSLAIVFIVMSLINVYAQAGNKSENVVKKELSAAKGYLKSGNDLEKGEQSMLKLLKDSANRDNEKIWETLIELVKKQYDKGNEQMYLKQKADTGKLFVNARKLFDVCQAYDSVLCQPGRKDREVEKFRKKHIETLLQYRRNLYNGGMFFVKKQNFKEAFSMFDTFIGCNSQPMFSNYHLMQTDSASALKAAYMSMYCGYKMKDAQATLKYASLSMRDTACLNNKYQYLAETYLLEKDTARCVATLEKGFERFPLSLYYFPRLFNYYFKTMGDMTQTRRICDYALRADSTSMVFLFAYSSLMLQQEQFETCIDICDQLIARNDTLADAYLNAGLAYFNQTIKISNSPALMRNQRARLRNLYNSARPYMEHYRQLCPDKRDIWGLPLYTIYLNLNMGKEFEEIENILENGKK